MKYEGQSIQCLQLDDGIVELKFDLKDDSVNKFNKPTLKELREAVNQIKKDSSIRGLLMTSGKDVFVVGADVTEFLSHFKKPKEELVGWVNEVNGIFSDIEDLGFPSVCAINGFALG